MVKKALCHESIRIVLHAPSIVVVGWASAGPSPTPPNSCHSHNLVSISAKASKPILLLQQSLESGVPSVLDSIVRSPRDPRSDLSPFVA